MPPDLTDDGLRAALEIRREQPDVGVLMFSQHLVERYVTELVGDDARGVGYVLKHRIADLGYFIDAVRTVGSGGTALDPEVVARMLGRRRRTDPLEALTPREREVLALMAEGLSNNGHRGAADRRAARGGEARDAIFSKLDIGRDRAENQRVLAVLALSRCASSGMTPRSRVPRSAPARGRACRRAPRAGPAARAARRRAAAAVVGDLDHQRVAVAGDADRRRPSPPRAWPRWSAPRRR